MFAFSDSKLKFWKSHFLEQKAMSKVIKSPGHLILHIYIYMIEPKLKCDRPRTSALRIPQEANNNESNKVILKIKK